MFLVTPEKLFVLLRSDTIEKANRDRCVRLFYDAAKVIHYRQSRLGKRQLKMKEFASAIWLVHFYHSQMFRFDVTGALACNFGEEFPEDRAIEYFEQSVMGSVQDLWARKVVIEDSGLVSLYKEEFTGRHIVAPENYEPVRGKRLPWIRFVIERSTSVFRVDETLKGKFRRTFLYTGIASIPLKTGASVSYFVVVVREENGTLKFVTAFHVQSHNRFLKRIEEGIPVERL
jgi:hypothetical protein